MIVINPVVSSIRSRQTGHVGDSKGLEADCCAGLGVSEEFAMDNANDDCIAWDSKLGAVPCGASNIIFLTYMTQQTWGCMAFTTG